MAEDTSDDIHDLVLVVDATSSMQAYLTALRNSLPRIISISALTGCFSRIGLLGYRDYCDQQMLDWSGWLDPAAPADDASQPNLLRKAQDMEPVGGGDWPEALKTALARAYELARPEANTLILLYTDAPPHLIANKIEDRRYLSITNYPHEQKALNEHKAYGGLGSAFADWVSACRTLRRGTKQFQIFSLVPSAMQLHVVGTFVYLGTMVNGATIRLDRQEAGLISKVTIEVLLAWMGVAKAGLSEQTIHTNLWANLVRYINGAGISNAKHENDPAMKRFFLVKDEWGSTDSSVRQNIAQVTINHEVLMKHLPKKKNPATDFAKRWATSAPYREMAVLHLSRIIRDDVQAMATNPVFGTLWRAFCNDRTNPHRESVIKQFSEQIESIKDPGDKERMKTWLEESYDYGAEILETIENVPEAERFPCVCLDPTLNFELRTDASGNENPVAIFTRAELLEIGRSCDSRILSRLSRLLTRLTYINTAEEMPEHLAATSIEEVPRLPMALTKQNYGRKFWRYLLHLVLPGTLLSTRPAALLAALGLSIGLTPLVDSAEEEVMLNREKWNDIETPENWNSSCLSLLIDADNAYRARHPSDSKSLLISEDRALFEQLIAFHTLEMNLNTPLTARIGWTPDKATAPIGPLYKCRECDLPRSVTIMQKDRICGICAAEDYTSPEEKAKAIARRASKDQSHLSPATWVECCMPHCRAQYVVYNVEDLNVRAKCHYCRQASSSRLKSDTAPAPTVQCIKCLNRMIWPDLLRPKGFNVAEFTCPGCQSEQKTVVDADVTPLQLQTTSEIGWLVTDKKDPTAFPFSPNHAQPIFKIVSKYSPNDFLSRIKLLDTTIKDLNLNGKPLHDPAQVRSTLQAWVTSRHVGKDVCSMCFTSTSRSHSSLTKVCGRRGCSQKACRECMEQWYGLNKAGHIINVAALSCPFCRRLAAGNRLRRYGNGVHAVTGLQLAARDVGRWIHGWCRSCDHAKRYVARECARGMPAEIANWQCEDCVERARALRRLQARLRQQILEGDLEAGEIERLEKELGSLKRGPIRRCPGCGVLTEKDGGCDHMECSQCHVHWCWVCQKTWGDHEIADHMLSAHGGFLTLSEDEDDETDD